MLWFKHDSDASLDAKLQNVLLDYGLEGYGLYWYCVELINGDVSQDNITFELQHDARIIARNTGSTAQKVSEMMAYFVDLGLFESSNNTITCLKLAKRLDKSMTSNPKMRALIDQLKDSKTTQNHDSVMINHDGVMTNLDFVMQDKKRREEKRRDSGRFTPPTLEQVTEYCRERKNNIDPELFIDHYTARDWILNNKLKMRDWQSSVRTWEKNKQYHTPRNSKGTAKLSDDELLARASELKIHTQGLGRSALISAIEAKQ